MVRIKLDQDVDIAFRAEVVAQHGAEQCESANVMATAEVRNLVSGNGDARSGHAAGLQHLRGYHSTPPARRDDRLTVSLSSRRAGGGAPTARSARRRQRP